MCPKPINCRRGLQKASIAVAEFVMAAVGRRLQVVTDGEATVLRQVETVVDERTGLIQQRERIAYGVETEDGDMAVYVQDRVETARVVS